MFAPTLAKIGEGKVTKMLHDKNPDYQHR